MIALKHEPVDRATVYHVGGGIPVLEIGRFSYAAGLKLGVFDPRSRVRIGNFVSIADDVLFFLRTNHHPEWLTTYPPERLPWPGDVPRPADPHLSIKDDITIGNDVWISYGVRVLAGVAVADGAVIAAGSVVTRDVRPYAFVAGNPAREIKRRFDDQTVATLLKLKWWDLPTEQIRKMAPVLAGGNVQDLELMMAPGFGAEDFGGFDR
jgi:acetyltransferase-like isoleucine patch superfamily enzyme